MSYPKTLPSLFHFGSDFHFHGYLLFLLPNFHERHLIFGICQRWPARLIGRAVILSKFLCGFGLSKRRLKSYFCAYLRYTLSLQQSSWRPTTRWKFGATIAGWTIQCPFNCFRPLCLKIWKNCRLNNHAKIHFHPPKWNVVAENECIDHVFLTCVVKQHTTDYVNDAATFLGLLRLKSSSFHYHGHRLIPPHYVSKMFYFARL